MGDKVLTEIDIILATHNHLDLTIQAVDCLYEFTSKPFRLIVVDDSTDGLTPLYFKKLMKENRQFAGGGRLVGMLSFKILQGIFKLAGVS